MYIKINVCANGSFLCTVYTSESEAIPRRLLEMQIIFSNTSVLFLSGNYIMPETSEQNQYQEMCTDSQGNLLPY
jgi:hypothetical protein